MDRLDDSGSCYTVAVSVGVARFDPEYPLSLGDLMSQADRDMYKQKRRHSTKFSVTSASA